MRVVSTVGLMVLMLAVAASAQSPLKFGIKAGATMATLTGDGWDVIAAQEEETIDKGYKTGLAGGLFVELPLGASGVSLQPEFLYVMKGAKADVTFEEGAVTEIFKNDYIEVPVLVKYNFTTAGGASPFMFVGPVAAFNIASKIEWDDIPAGTEEYFEDVDIDNAKSIDFGATIGAGLGLAMGPASKLTFDLRYTIGLGKVFDDVDSQHEDKDYAVDQDGNGLELKNSDIRLMVGFQF